jgi:hypothetical protein
MDDLISRQAAIERIESESRTWGDEYGITDVLCDLDDLPSAEPQSVEIDERLAKIADLVEGTIDHFDRDDAMDALYQIKGVLK